MKPTSSSSSAEFESYRTLLQGIAYRMLGSVVEAEDIVQETYLKWVDCERNQVQNPRSWLVTVCSRLSIDRLKSAQYQRENYVGPWLPEPLVVSETSPFDEASIDDSVSIALLYTLERLSPGERASFLLHDVFDYSFDEVAAILEKTPEACRKLASRARARAKENKPRFETSPETHELLMDSFFKAVKEGDLDGIKNLLAEDATLISDGGGKALAARKILEGAAIIGKFFVNIAKQEKASLSQFERRFAWYNGAPGLLVFENGNLVTAINLGISNGRIQNFYIHRNPDKLALMQS